MWRQPFYMKSFLCFINIKFYFIIIIIFLNINYNVVYYDCKSIILKYRLIKEKYKTYMYDCWKVSKSMEAVSSVFLILGINSPIKCHDSAAVHIHRLFPNFLISFYSFTIYNFQLST